MSAPRPTAPPDASERAAVLQVYREADDPRFANRRAWRRALLLALAFAAAGFAAFSMDLTIGRACVTIPGQTAAFRVPGDIRKAVNLMEFFGHGFGVAVIILTTCVLDPTSRRQLGRLIACAFGAGLVVTLIKALIGRFRPYAFIPEHGTDSTVWVRDTFAGLLPSHEMGSAIQSFPSGHTATAVGLAVVLAWRYPRGRYLFTFFAVMVALQRILSGSHYVSDTLFGAAVGIAFASACIYTVRLGGFFDRLADRCSTAPTE